MSHVPNLFYEEWKKILVKNEMKNRRHINEIKVAMCTLI